jgi:hypothetical protein
MMIALLYFFSYTNSSGHTGSNVEMPVSSHLERKYEKEIVVPSKQVSEGAEENHDSSDGSLPHV